MLYITEVAPEGIFVKDTDGDVVYKVSRADISEIAERVVIYGVVKNLKEDRHIFKEVNYPSRASSYEFRILVSNAMDVFTFDKFETFGVLVAYTASCMCGTRVVIEDSLHGNLDIARKTADIWEYKIDDGESVQCDSKDAAGLIKKFCSAGWRTNKMRVIS